ncbi:putative toxin-antitoxin system toxin component, PIN family [Candidatus Roizmanbacteria bacterium RIFCSPLOWO2_01_FULL_37_13]|uniref:Putative toxin-antitoxin system toxin component, PIN family n=1 Tax=Candidatus Roizmanbacteria bacterium RIFCSPHIGHO2_02_FULL_38_11 TaxID=1802039 RepID=A0A1F7H2W0_9BACT|nr:MAG: putative toxin-antitoxin system toxin component, PIN family [Candidatus Roizmanbacteria bacterium RIFCSPHIGHO2_02_FULL_38_11]OGK41000.1 MAG: putative toxin-antitoxin system toxin component, PIN family [Candidatus Roizmanbacteria bacterium RIFCSPLOWO2_01_FULL_37_13]
MKIILDTSVIIAFLLSKGSTNLAEIIKLAKTKKIALLVCKEIFLELQNTLHLKKIKKTSSYKSVIIARFIAWYKYNAVFVSLTKLEQIKLARDWNDNIFIQLSIQTDADYLISVDKDLLILKKAGKTIIVTPEQFFKDIRK